MTYLDFTNGINTAQSTLRTLLFNNATVASLTSMVLDGSPSISDEKTAYPYVLVHTPMVEDITLTTGPKPLYKSVYTFQIEIVGRNEGNVRQLVDAVRKTIMSNFPTTRAIGLFHPEIGRTRMSIGKTPSQTGNPTIYNITFPLRYNSYGSSP